MSSARSSEAIEDYGLDEQPPPPPVVAPTPYLPSGGQAFVPQPGTFNCAPPGFTVIPASFLPNPTADTTAAIDAALTAARLTPVQRGQIARASLVPIAAELGVAALTELFARLRWSNDDIVRWGRNADGMLVPRLLLHIPGHFRELARRAPSAAEAFVLECLGWMLMAKLRDAVATATTQRWWLPPAPDFVTAVPNPIPSVSSEVSRMILRHLWIDTTMTAGHWNAKFQGWATRLPGRQWNAERTAARPGLPFYANMVTVPPHISLVATRAAFAAGWARRLADTDARFAPLGAGATTVTLSSLQNAIALRDCPAADPFVPANALGALDLQGLELATDFPMPTSGRTIRRLTLMTQLHPVFSALFQAIKALGWNDLLYQSSGGACFRGVKHDATARITVGGVSTTVNPFGAPTAATVTHINTDFTPAQRATVLAAVRTARTLSEHGLGAAIDFDYQENVDRVAARPFGSMDPRIVAIFEAFNFRWGACFAPTDPMHFDYCAAACAPAAAVAPPAPAVGPLPGMIPTRAGPVIA
jgi:D-alanyl-D-alanine carboxypeptidase